MSTRDGSRAVGGMGGTSDSPLRFRPQARRRNRIAAGIALGAVAIGGNVLAYTSIDDAEPVVQAVRDIPAGDVITADMLRIVDVELDDAVNAVPGDQLDLLVGSYAKVRIVSGSLVVTQALQPDPLVTPGRAIVAVVIPPAELPAGLRERVPVQVVIPPRSVDDVIQVVDAVTVGLPADVGNALGERSVSLEVATRDAALVAAADEVRIVLVEPGAGASSGTDAVDAAVDPTTAAESGTATAPRSGVTTAPESGPTAPTESGTVIDDTAETGTGEG